MNKKLGFIASLFLVLSSFNIISPAIYNKWGNIRKIANQTRHNIKFDERWLARENNEGGWNWNPPKLQQNNTIIQPGETITIPSLKSLDFASLEIPQLNTRGRSDEIRIRLRGIGEKEKDLLLTTGKILELNPLMGVGIAWLTDRIDNKKSISFWAQSNDKDELVFGETISTDYLFKVVLGQNESKIITRDEEIRSKEITNNNEALIIFGDSIILKNIKTGEILQINPKDKKAITVKKNKYDKDDKWQILPKPVDPTDTHFLKDGSTCGIFSSGYLNARFGGANDITESKIKESRWNIIKLDRSTGNEFIKHGDKVKLLSIHDNSFLVPSKNKNKLVENRFPNQNNANVWQILLANPKEKIDQALRYPKVTRQQNPNAMAQGGMKGLYWISILDNLVLVGYGYQPGKNLFLSRKLPADFAGKINFMGLSSDKRGTNYTSITTGNPIFSKESERIYATIDTSISVPALKGKFQWLKDYPFRSSNRGAVNFEAKAKDGINVGLSKTSDGSDVKYAIEIGADNNSAISVFRRKGGKLVRQYSTYPKNPIPTDQEFHKYQVSINDGLIIVKIDGRMIFAWQDTKPFDHYNYVGLGSVNSPVEYKKIQVTPAVRFELKRTAHEYRRLVKNLQEGYQQSFRLMTPFEYWIQHSGHNIRITDPIYNPTGWDVVGMEKTGPHNFRVDINKAGTPRIISVEDAKGGVAEKALNIGAETLGDIGEAVSQAAGGGAQGEGPKSPAGAAAAAIGGATQVGAKLMKNILKEVFAPTTGIYTEEARTATAAGKTDEQVEKANAAIAQLFEQLDGIDQNPYFANLPPEKLFTKKVRLYNRIIDNIISPENITPPMRKRVLRNIKRFYSQSATLPPDVYEPLTNLLIGAYDNRFLLNPENSQMEDQRGDIYNQINIVTRRLFIGMSNNQIPEVEIQPFYGEAIWYPQEFATPNEGSVFFEAQAQKDVFVIFYNDITRIRKLREATELDQVNIGGWNNTKTAICSDGNGQAEVSISASKAPDAMAKGIGFRKYWASYKDGIVKFGIVEDGKIIQKLEWKDRYPLKRVRHVGFSNWDTSIKLKNVQIGPPIEEILKNLSKPEEPKVKPVEKITTEPTPAKEPVIEKRRRTQKREAIKQKLMSITPATEESPAA